MATETVPPATAEDVLPEKGKIVKEVRTLKHKFDMEEKMDMTDQLCDKLAALEQIDASKKECNDEFKSQASKVDAEITRLRKQLTSGYEERQIDCETRMHVPEQGTKTTYRMDTMEIVKSIAMTTFECQDTLFPDGQEEDEGSAGSAGSDGSDGSAGSAGSDGTVFDDAEGEPQDPDGDHDGGEESTGAVPEE